MCFTFKFWSLQGVAFASGTCQWHELARPQVHGYDLAALSLVSPTLLVSAAEEKVVRVFRAPTNFLANYKSIVGEALEAEVEGTYHTHVGNACHVGVGEW